MMIQDEEGIRSFNSCVGGRIEKLVSKYLLQKDIINELQKDITNELQKGKLDEISLDQYNATFTIALAEKFDYSRLYFSFNEKDVSGYILCKKNFTRPEDAYGLLEGITNESNLVIEPLSEKDISYCIEALEQNYTFGLISSIGTPSTKKHVLAPIDELLLRIDDMRAKRNIERIDVFFNMQKCSNLRLKIRKLLGPKKRDKKGYEIELTNEELHYINETEMMFKTNMVICQVGILVKCRKEHKGIISNALKSNIEAIYSGFVNKFKMKFISQSRLKDILQNNKITVFSKTCSAYSARVIIGNLYNAKPYLPMVSRVIAEPDNKIRISDNPILLGWTTQGREIRLNLTHYVSHRTIIGMTGCGKSEQIMSEVEQLIEVFPDKRVIIFDDSGEYTKYFVTNEKMRIYELNSELAPLRINPFVDPFVDDDEFVNSMSAFFSEALITQEDMYSAQMKRVIREGLLQIIRLDIGRRNFNEYRKLIDEYCDRNPSLNKGDMTRNALQNRMSIFQYDLNKVFYVDSSNWSPEEIENNHMIFNLRNIRAEAKNVVINYILFRLRNYMKSLGKQELRVFVFVEEAQENSPSRKRFGSNIRTSLEKAINEIRKWAVHITLIGTMLDNLTETAQETGVMFNYSDKLSHNIGRIMGYSYNFAEVDELGKYQMHVKLPENKRFLLVDKINRPRRRELKEEEYLQFLEESEVYSEQRRQGNNLDLYKPKDELESELNRRAEDIFEICIETKCKHGFHSLADCLAVKSSGHIILSIKRSVSDVLNKYSSLDELYRTLERDHILVLDEINDSVQTIVNDKALLMGTKLSQSDRDNIAYCVFATILKILFKEAVIELNDVERLFNLIKNESDCSNITDTNKDYFDDDIWED